MRRPLCFALLALLAGCGSRTSPSVGPVADRDAGPPGFDAGDVDGGPPWACRYEATGEPMVIFDQALHRDGIDAPELIVLEEGSEARLALSATHPRGWHPEIHIAEVLVGPRWPDDVRVGRSWAHVGLDAHGNGQLAPTADGRGIALAWFQGDFARGAPSGVSFRTLDPDGWTARSAQLIQEGSGSAYAIVPWEDGYAVALRTSSGEAAIAQLGSDGRLMGEPIVTNPRGVGAVGTSVAATASSLVTVTNDERGVELGRLAPPIVTPTGRVEAATGRRPRAPTIRAGGGLTYAVWREESLDEEDRTFALRVARVDAEGALEGVVFERVARVLRGPALAVASTGAVALWGELVDPEAMEPSQILVLQRVTPDDAVAERLEVPVEGLRSGEPYHAVTMNGGRTLIVTWSGPSAEHEDSVIHLARFDCRAL